MQNQQLLACDRVSYTTDRGSILSDISFDLNIGDILTIIGPNGGGKTTLAKMILGILSPSSGHIIRKKNLSIGYTPQRINLNQLVPITVKEFLFFYGSVDYTHNESKRILEESKIDHILDKQIYSLSGGELQRILFARALLKDPELLILDEPIQGLDVVGQKDFYFRLEQLRSKRNKTIIMISHDLHTVMSASDKVICLNHTVHCLGKPCDVKSHKSYHKFFSLDEVELISAYKHEHKAKKNG
jgi:zinc transport system ATP-binding protein